MITAEKKIHHFTQAEKDHEIYSLDLSYGDILVIDRNDNPVPSLLGRLDLKESQAAMPLAIDYMSQPHKRGCRPIAPADFEQKISTKPILGEVCPMVEGPYGELICLSVIPRPIDNRVAMGLVWTITPVCGPTAISTLRDICGRCESYEPFVATSFWALDMLDAPQNTKPVVRLGELRNQLKYILDSPITLNKRLRSVVTHAIECGDTASGIAKRAGMIRKEPGRICGETSWLMRRIGMTAEGNRKNLPPGKWIHAKVLSKLAYALDMASHELEMPMGISYE